MQFGGDSAIARRFHHHFGSHVQIDRFAKHRVERVVDMPDFRGGEWMGRLDDHEHRSKTDSILEREINEAGFWKSL